MKKMILAAAVAAIGLGLATPASAEPARVELAMADYASETAGVDVAAKIERLQALRVANARHREAASGEQCISDCCGKVEVTLCEDVAADCGHCGEPACGQCEGERTADCADVACGDGGGEGVANALSSDGATHG